MPVPDPGGPIGGSAIHFGLRGLLLVVCLLIGYAVLFRSRPSLLFAPLIVSAVFTEEVVFQVGFTWTLGIIYSLILLVIIPLSYRQLGVPRDLFVSTTGLVAAIFLAFFSAVFTAGTVPFEGIFTRALRESLRWSAILALPLILVGVIREEDEWQQLLWLHVLTAAIISSISVFAMIARYTGFLPDIPAAILIESGGGNTLRLSGTFNEPSQFANYLAPTLFIAIGFAMVNDTRRNTQSWACVFAILTALFFTFSTTGWVLTLGGTLFGSVLYYLIAMEHGITTDSSFHEAFPRVLTLGVVGFLFTIIVLVGFRPAAGNIPDMAYRILIGKFASITELRRWNALVAGIGMWGDNLVFGVGLGNHVYHFNNYASDPVPDGRGPSTVYVGVLAMTGIVGITMFINYLRAIYRMVVSRVRRINTNLSWGVFVALITLFGSYAINYNFITVFNVFLLGMAAAAHHWSTPMGRIN